MKVDYYMQLNDLTSRIILRSHMNFFNFYILEIKKTLGHTMIEQVCLLYPQIRDHVDFVDIGTPVTNSYYLAAPHGEIYGLDHTKTRMSPEVRLDL